MRRHETYSIRCRRKWLCVSPILEIPCIITVFFASYTTANEVRNICLSVMKGHS